MTRKNFSPKTKAQIRERSGGVCEVHRIPEESRRVRYAGLPESCDRKGEEVDHVKPAWMGGEPTLENGANLCKRHHAIKTVTDNKEAKRAARLRGETGQRKRRDERGPTLQGRGFAGSRKFDGTVTWKERT